MSNSKTVQGHQARKRFGQNFLSDNFYIQRIIQSIAPQQTDFMVEIGPGLGAITEHLIDQVQQLDLIELDRDLVPRLEFKFRDKNNFSIHQADALKFDFHQLYQQQAFRLVGNLPYNISTPLIFHLLKHGTIIKDMYFMLQKEVVQRICAEPNSSHYGRLSVMSQYYCQAQMLFVVPPGAFQPAPKVDSAIIRLQPHQQLPHQADDPQLLAQLVTGAFNQRRKTLRNSVKNWLTAEQLVALDIDPQRRAETVSLAEFVKMTNSITKSD